MMNYTDEVKQMATHILSGMLSNPHIYAEMSDDRRTEHKLVILATQMAEDLVNHIEEKESFQPHIQQTK
ncbi:MAG: hypothetical protein ACOC04_02660 [Halothece sp.]